MNKLIIQQIEEKIGKWRKPERKYWEKLKETVKDIEDEDEIIEKLAEEDMKSKSRYTISNILLGVAINKYHINYREKLPKVGKAYDKKGY